MSVPNKVVDKLFSKPRRLATVATRGNVLVVPVRTDSVDGVLVALVAGFDSSRHSFLSSSKPHQVQVGGLPVKTRAVSQTTQYLTCLDIRVPLAEV